MQLYFSVTLQRVKHSQLAKCVERALSNKEFIFDADPAQLELCYAPSIQSGGNYDFNITAGSDQNYLDSGVIVCSFGVRYKSYCSHLSRTLLAKPSKATQSNYDFLKNLEKRLLDSLIPGAKLNEIYESALEFTKKVKPELVDHLVETFGSAIGIQFDECALTIGPKCMAIVEKDMVFNLRVGLNRLTDNQVDGKAYALLHSNTVAVNALGPATILTAPPAYLKLIADCWEHIFDYLSFKDIIAMERTCVRMHRMAGYYIRENFPNFVYDLNEDKVKLYYMDQTFYPPINFRRFIVKLSVQGNLNSDLSAEQFSSVKTLRLDDTILYETQFGYLRNVLQNVEDIELSSCSASEETSKELHRQCPKLKCLRILWGSRGIRTVFSQSYPLLEHLKFHMESEISCYIEMKTFLDGHKNLKHFECEDRILWAHQNLLIHTNVQLDLLTVLVTTAIAQTDKFAKFLKWLYARGFFRKLHLNCVYVENIELADLNNALYTWPVLEKFEIPRENADLDLSRLVDLTELDLCFEDLSKNLDVIASSLTKLVRLSFDNFRGFSVDILLPFIRHCKRLKFIEILRNFSEEFDLSMLNQERKYFGEEMTHILIHLPERNYLRERWNSKNRKLSHIEIARSIDFY